MENYKTLFESDIYHTNLKNMFNNDIQLLCDYIIITVNNMFKKDLKNMKDIDLLDSMSFNQEEKKLYIYYNNYLFNKFPREDICDILREIIGYHLVIIFKYKLNSIHFFG